MFFDGTRSYCVNEREECGDAVSGEGFQWRRVGISLSFSNNPGEVQRTVSVMQSFLSFICAASEIAHYGSNKENYLRTGYAGSLFLRRSSSHV